MSSDGYEASAAHLSADICPPTPPSARKRPRLATQSPPQSEALSGMDVVALENQVDATDAAHPFQSELNEHEQKFERETKEPEEDALVEVSPDSPNPFVLFSPSPIRFKPVFPPPMDVDLESSSSSSSSQSDTTSSFTSMLPSPFISPSSNFLAASSLQRDILLSFFARSFPIPSSSASSLLPTKVPVVLQAASPFLKAHVLEIKQDHGSSCFVFQNSSVKFESLFKKAHFEKFSGHPLTLHLHPSDNADMPRVLVYSDANCLNLLYDSQMGLGLGGPVILGAGAGNSVGGVHVASTASPLIAPAIHVDTVAHVMATAHGLGEAHSFSGVVAGNQSMSLAAPVHSQCTSQNLPPLPSPMVESSSSADAPLPPLIVPNPCYLRLDVKPPKGHEASRLRKPLSHLDILVAPFSLPGLDEFASHVQIMTEMIIQAASRLMEFQSPATHVLRPSAWRMHLSIIGKFPICLLSALRKHLFMIGLLIWGF